MLKQTAGYIALAGASAYSIIHLEEKHISLISITLAICLVHALLGILRAYRCSTHATNMYQLTATIIETLPFALMATEYGSHSKKIPQLRHVAKSYVLLGVGIIPILADFFIDDAAQGENIRDLSVLICAGALLLVGGMDHKHCILVLGAVGLLIRFGSSYIADNIKQPYNVVVPLLFAIFCGLICLTKFYRC